MAKKTISQLPVAESMGENDVLLMETQLATKCITKSSLLQDVNTTLATKANTEHTHTMVDVTDLQDALDGKANTADLADVATSGSYDDLTGTPEIPAAYVLPQATDTDLGGIKVGEGLAIDSESGVLSLNSHTHAIGDITDLQNTLNEKADAVHTHNEYLTEIPTSLPANGGNAATVNNISLEIKTTEEYIALETKSNTTLYIISDGGKIYLGSTLIAEVNPTPAATTTETEIG